MQGVSVLQYLKEFFKQIVFGRTDYENLLPMTVGINNIKNNSDFEKLYKGIT